MLLGCFSAAGGAQLVETTGKEVMAKKSHCRLLEICDYIAYLHRLGDVIAKM